MWMQKEQKNDNNEGILRETARLKMMNTMRCEQKCGEREKYLCGLTGKNISHAI